MNSKEPGAEGEPEVETTTPEEQPVPAPEPEEAEEPVSAPEEPPSAEEEYEELIVPEKPIKPRKKRKHVGAYITVAVILIILVAWTLASPKLLAAQGRTYVDSGYYANLGDFAGYHKNWAANTTWGISVRGEDNVTVNETFTISILITKVSEKPNNFWFRGTAIAITNMSVLDEDNRTIALLNNKSDPGYGKEGTLVLSLSTLGDHTLKVKAQFLVYVDMRIGFLPVEKIDLQPLELRPIRANPAAP